MSTSVAFVGYGRFGAALAERFLDVGILVKAHDPQAAVPDEIATSSLEAALDHAEHVILAVPVAKTRPVLTLVKPHLRRDQLVMDVGSVKTGPVALMEDVFGTEIPWLGTHPLFGPTSLALGQRPLRVVLCPNNMHPRAIDRAAALFGTIGCEIIEQDPETHDTRMAESHALTYFVAKGFLDSGVELDSPLAPPSVQAIVRTVDAVREDAAHLFASLHRENPYAGEARRKLLDALSAIDAALRAPSPRDEEAHEEEGVLHMSALEHESDRLGEARKIIDQIDRDLLALLAQRAEVSLHAARAKADIGRGIRDPEREARLLQARGETAARLGLDRSAVEEVFHAILRFSRRHQVSGDA